jgi:hypothetical protein
MGSPYTHKSDVWALGLLLLEMAGTCAPPLAPPRLTLTLGLWGSAALRMVSDFPGIFAAQVGGQCHEQQCTNALYLFRAALV